MQNRGMVTALAWRLVVYPNMYQHQVMPCELVDKSRPGHAKLLRFYLTDLYHSVFDDRVKSTSRVPPQQAEWVANAWAGERRAFLPNISREGVDLIVGDVDAVVLRRGPADPV